jgi:hypothetical protein
MFGKNCLVLRLVIDQADQENLRNSGKQRLVLNLQPHLLRSIYNNKKN